MFGIGYQEMFIVLVVAMIIFGPARLPELAGQVGRWVRDFRRMSTDLTGEFEKTFAEVDEVKKSFQRELSGLQDEMEGTAKSTKGALKSGSKSVTTKKPAALGAGKGNAAKGAAAKAAPGTKTNGARAAAAARKAKTKATNGALPVATKDDPLVDVSFLELDSMTAKNGATAATEDEALSRVRKRRAAAAYSRRVPA